MAQDVNVVIRFVVVIKLGKLVNVVDVRIEINFNLKILKYDLRNLRKEGLIGTHMTLC